MIDPVGPVRLHWLLFLGLSLVLAGLAGSHLLVNPYRLAVWLYSSDTGHVVIESRCAGREIVALRHRQVVTAGYFEYLLPLPRCRVTSIALTSDNAQPLHQEAAVGAITYYGTVVERLLGTPRTLEGEGIFARDTRPNRAGAINLSAPLVLHPAALDAAEVRLAWPRWLPFLFLPLAWWLARRVAAAARHDRANITAGGPYSFFIVVVLTLVATMAVIARTDVSVHPDELAHAASARYYFDHWLKPGIGAPDTLEAHRTNRYGFAYLTGTEPVYLLAGKFAVLFWPVVQNDVVGLRMFNVALFGVLAIFALWRIDARLAVLPLLATPQAWYAFSYFNGDALPLVLSTLAVVAFLGISKSGENAPDPPASTGVAAWAGCLAGLILLSKPNYWAVLGVIALLLMARGRYVSQSRFGLLSLGWVLTLLGALFFLDGANGMPLAVRMLPLAAGLGFLSWQGTRLARNVVLRHARDVQWLVVAGAVLVATIAVVGLKMVDEARENSLPFFAKRAEALVAATEVTAVARYKPSARTSDARDKNYQLRDQGVSLGEMFAREDWFGWSTRSFLGVYGYLNIGPASNFAYALGGAFLLVAMAIGVVVGRHAPPGTGAAVQFALLVGAITIVAASIGSSWLQDLQPQGRYLLGILPILGGGLVVAGPAAAGSRPLQALVAVAFALSMVSFLLIGIQGIPKMPALY